LSAKKQTDILRFHFLKINTESESPHVVLGIASQLQHYVAKYGLDLKF